MSRFSKTAVLSALLAVFFGLSGASFGQAVEEATSVPMLSPEAVEVRHFPGDFVHDSIWDVFAGPDGRIYVSVCSEGYSEGHVVSASAMLYAYDIAKDKMEHLFDVEKVTHAPPRTIPQSKIHTSMAAMEDGRLIMSTHTTAPAPGHPLWAPVECYDDIWEGYPGSHIIVYDPKTNHAEDWGIPVPRESTYGGGCYVERTRDYYMLGLLRGHLYAFNVDIGKTRDLGRAGVGIRLFHDDDGRVYGIGEGVMFRYDPFRDVLEDLDLPIPQEGAPDLGFADRGPDGLYYVVRLLGRQVFSFDPHQGTQGTVAEVGKPMEGVIWGMRFGLDGTLYCAVQGDKGGPFAGKMGLYRWDVIGGKEPEFLGVPYIEGKPTIFTWEMAVGSDGRLYLPEFYATKNPRLLIIDPRKAAAADADSDQAQGEAPAAKSDTSPGEDDVIPLSRKVLPAGESDVVGLAVDDAGRVHVATTGKAGWLAAWDGNVQHLPVALHRDDEGYAALATDGSTVFVVTGPKKHSVLAYDAAAAKESLELHLVAEFPEDCPPLTLGFDKAKGRLYGLAGLENKIFVIDLASGNLKMGPPTGALVAGRRTVIAGSDGCLYGALDQGWIFRYDPESGELKKLEARLPALNGREFLSRWESAVLAPDGTIYGGTSDGYLFHFDPPTAKMRNIGKPVLSLGMPALALAADGTVYGVTGTKDDLARLVRYTQAEGLKDLCMCGGIGPPYQNRSMPVANCLVVMPAAAGVLVAGADRINNLALYRF